MKKAFAILIFLALILGILAPAWADSDPYNVQVKQLYAQPDGRSKLVYQIPIDVKMLDVSEDANWYKVKIQFNLGIVSFKYTGWAYIPVGEILAERAGKEIATLK